MSENADYSFQNKIPSLVVPHTATFVGTGAFGSWASVFSARVGVKRLILINPSKATGGRDIEGRSIACGPYRNDQFGMAKVAALKQLISEARPDAEVITHERFYDPDKDANLLEGVVFIGVSDSRIFQALWHQSRAHGLQCVSGLYYGIEVGALTKQPPNITFDLDAPVWTVSAAMSGALAVHAAFTHESGSYFGDLSDLFKSGVHQLGHNAI